MKKDMRVQHDLEGFLGKAFPDDLPGDAEAMMRRQLDRFRQEWVKAEREEASLATRPRSWTTASVRVFLAGIFVFLSILGFRLLAPSPPADLGSSLASLQLGAFFSGRIMDFQSMECAVRLDRPEKPSEQFFIQWISLGETRVRLVIAGEEVVRTVHPPKPDESVLEFMAGSGPGKAVFPAQLEAELRPVEGLLSPAQLRTLLEGRWWQEGSEQRDGCDWKSFSVNMAPNAAASKVTIDSCTSLPVRLERELGSGEKIEAFFRWAPRNEPRGHLFPRHVSQGTKETTPS